jgi:dTMP kinase
MALDFNAQSIIVSMDGKDVRRGSGKLIVVDGIDQSGKKTQTLMLARKIQKFGYRTSNWSFPDYATPLGRQLKLYLTGRTRFDFHAVHLLYAANKWENADSISRELKLGHIVIMNRYTPSNLAYGIAHRLSPNWLEQLEADLPKPDLTLILDIPPEVSFKRKRHLRDVHEENLSYLHRVRDTYLRLAKKYRWRIIDAEHDAEIVSQQLWKFVEPIL